MDGTGAGRHVVQQGRVQGESGSRASSSTVGDHMDNVHSITYRTLTLQVPLEGEVAP